MACLRQIKDIGRTHRLGRTPRVLSLSHHRECSHSRKRLNRQIHEHREFKRPLSREGRVIPSGYRCDNNKLGRRLKISEDYVLACKSNLAQLAFGEREVKTPDVSKFGINTWSPLCSLQLRPTPRSILPRERRARARALVVTARTGFSARTSSTDEKPNGDK